MPVPIKSIALVTASLAVTYAVKAYAIDLPSDAQLHDAITHTTKALADSQNAISEWKVVVTEWLAIWGIISTAITQGAALFKKLQSIPGVNIIAGNWGHASNKP